MKVDQFLTLADADLTKIIVSVLFAAFYLIAQFMSGREQHKRRRPQANPRPRPQPNPPAANMAGGRPGAADARKPNSLEESLRREVDEFLRRAQGKPENKPARSARPQRPQETPASRPVAQKSTFADADLRDPPAPERPRLKPLRSEEKTPAPLLPVKPTSRDDASSWGTSIAQHVAQSFRSQLDADRKEQPPDEIALTDERMAAHVHEVFDHQLGSLGRRLEVDDSAGRRRPPMAAEVLDLIRKPGGMRQLVIGSEILRRPDERF